MLDVFSKTASFANQSRKPGTDERLMPQGGNILEPRTNLTRVDIYHVLQQAESCLAGTLTLSDDLRCVLHQVILLDRQFSLWPAKQPEEWRPRSMRIGISQTREGLGFWPDKVDTYYDRTEAFLEPRGLKGLVLIQMIVYVAAAWNTYRKNRLMLLDIILRLLDRLQEKEGRREKQAEATELVSALMASVPYHLTPSLLHTGEDRVCVGKAIGGLLLMHPLYVSCNLSIVPPNRRREMRKCLAWIGQQMGIGQATVFSTARRAFYGR